MRLSVRVCVIALLAALLASCTHARLARPSVLKQMTPEVARMVNYLREVDRPNEAMIAKMFALGGLSHAELGDDGVRDSVYVPSGEFIWKPTIIVMPQPGWLELVFTNGDDFSHHAAYLPSNGDRRYIHLPMDTSGKAMLRLDGPGRTSTPWWHQCSPRRATSYSPASPRANSTPMMRRPANVSGSTTPAAAFTAVP